MEEFLVEGIAYVFSTGIIFIGLSFVVGETKKKSLVELSKKFFGFGIGLTVVAIFLICLIGLIKLFI